MCDLEISPSCGGSGERMCKHEELGRTAVSLRCRAVHVKMDTSERTMISCVTVMETVVDWKTD